MTEGDRGTWSHCGNSRPHAPHLHSFAMNEGRYDNVQCNGTPEPQPAVGPRAKAYPGEPVPPKGVGEEVVVEIEVHHYGPNVVPDPDHSTSIIVIRDRKRTHLVLENDAELGELYRKLGEALRKGDIK